MKQPNICYTIIIINLVSMLYPWNGFRYNNHPVFFNIRVLRPCLTSRTDRSGRATGAELCCIVYLWFLLTFLMVADGDWCVQTHRDESDPHGHIYGSLGHLLYNQWASAICLVHTLSHNRKCSRTWTAHVLNLIDLTDACNLACSTYFADSNGTAYFTMGQIKAALDVFTDDVHQTICSAMMADLKMKAIENINK